MPLDLLTEIYSSFEPFQPPSKEAYVECQDVRGGWEVIRELGRKITRSNLHYSPTGKNLIVRTSQKTDCFSARSLDELLAKAFEDFPKSS